MIKRYLVDYNPTNDRFKRHDGVWSSRDLIMTSSAEWLAQCAVQCNSEEDIVRFNQKCSFVGAIIEQMAELQIECVNKIAADTIAKAAKI